MSLANVSPATSTSHPYPDLAENIGFKDWGIICDALGSGRQSLILRKGGIAEGRAGFRFKHGCFFLFPTGFHQQFGKVRSEGIVPSGIPTATDAENVQINFLFALEFAHWIDDWEVIATLKPLHIWREDVIRERFEYGEQPGLQCAFGRIYRSESPWTFPNRPSYGGCRSWVTLPDSPADLKLVPVLDDAQHAHRKKHIENVLHLL